MTCRIRYLNSAGIMPREIAGVSALAKAFPSDWLFYVSLNCFPPKQKPMEIDAFVVTDDCVLLLEIKDWNGVLTTQGDRWIINKQSRGRSPVILGEEKAKKLKTVLKSHLGPIGSKIYVAQRVVLTGSADKSKLPQHEAQYVWTLAEACSLGDPQRRRTLLRGNSRMTLMKLTKLESEFEKLTGNSKLFQALEADWGGFQVVERDLFVHPKGIWQDHRGVRKDENRIKAMIRTWSFDRLPPGLNSIASRREVAARETQAFAFLMEVGSSLVSDNRVMRDISAPQDEVLTQHYEVRAVDDGWTTLDRYLERRSEDLSLQDRFVLASALLNIVSELHRSGVSHRDLGPRALWVGSPTGVALTGLMSCQLPDQQSVANWLDDLRGYAPRLPEDVERVASTGRQRDVYMLGYLTALVLTGERPQSGAEEAISKLPSGAEAIAPWLRKAMHASPASRFTDAAEMMQEFMSTTEPPQAGVDSSLLDRFETLTNPYVKWRIAAPLASRSECTVYRSTSESGDEVIVKIWNQLRRGLSSQVNLAVYRLLDSASRLKTAPVAGLPRFLECGLSPVGPYVVYEHMTGEKLSALTGFSEEEAIFIGRCIVDTVIALHALGFEHGDIAPANVILDRRSRRVMLLDAFDVTGVGNGSIRTPSVCPEDWEAWSGMALDRYGCLKVIEHILASAQGEQVVDLRDLIARELSRVSVESLEPVAAELAMKSAGAKPAAPQFELSTFANTVGFEAGRGFHVEVERTENGDERITLMNSGVQLVMEGDGERVKTHSFKQPTFPALARQSRIGPSMDIQVSVERGPDKGFSELYRALKVASPSLQPESPERAKGLDVAWQWRRLMELEEDGRIEVEIGEIIGSREGVVLCRYENLGREFDFDADAIVEVHNAAGKRIGEVDRGRSDFPAALALRVDSRVQAGDRLRLVDRREQTSIDRRNRAVTRILERRSALPNLIDYFAPDCELAPNQYQAGVVPEDLAVYSLNTGQREAFLKLLDTGPVGLLQGPPGTGKTRFIAAFIHWLLTRGGAQRILVASQSHEAVNNAIDSLVLLYKKLGGKPNLLRIGSKGITSRIKPYHSAELRERYRLKFEAAAKYRYSQLTSAKGIPRKFASDLYDLDADLGALARKAAALAGAIDAGGGRASSEEQTRRENRIRRAEAAFRKAASKFSLQLDEDTSPAEAYEQAIEALVATHHEVSPSDVEAARALLNLTRDWISAMGSPQRNFEEFLAKTRNVVTATCVGIGQSRIRIDAQLFDWVIVDEAARCTSGELAVPIQLARRVLLVGDQLQLRPMVSRDILDALQQENGAEDSRGELEASDFERAFASIYGDSISCRFTEQYRMDDAICRMISKCFYEPHSVTLRTSPERPGGLAVDPTGPAWLRKPMTWVDTTGHERAREGKPHGTTTRFNDAEVDAIISLLEDIASDRGLVEYLSKVENETPVGVICMYSGQKAKVERAWLQHAWEAKFRRLVRIDTVDAYQGKENEIVIVSLVCNNPRGDIGHVRSANRCNVALSRARERLIVVGAAKMFAGLPPKTPITSVLSYFKRDTNGASVISWEELQ